MAGEFWVGTWVEQKVPLSVRTTNAPMPPPSSPSQTVAEALTLSQLLEGFTRAQPEPSGFRGGSCRPCSEQEKFLPTKPPLSCCKVNTDFARDLLTKTFS